MAKAYIDTETCGLYGMPVLLQYAIDDGPIVLVDLWLQPVSETLALIEELCTHTVVGFNLVFDWFQLCKLYTVFRLCPGDWIPIEHVEEIARLEPEGRDGPCLKPASALDLMLHSRKGPYQSLMERDDVRIRRVPTQLAYELRDLLESRIEIDGIYFARRSEPNAPKWKVFDVKNRNGEISDCFKDVVLMFKPAGGLKYLAEYALKEKPKFHYKDVEPPREWLPAEHGYAPFAIAAGDPDNGWLSRKREPSTKEVAKQYAWPAVIQKHIKHWYTNENAREYASDDIRYTRALDRHFGYPEPGDDDSVLACMVAAVRWHGFSIDVAGIEELKRKALKVVKQCPVNVNATSQVRQYLKDRLTAVEYMATKLETTTEKNELVRLTKLVIEEDEPCTCEGNNESCNRCGGIGTLLVGAHPAAQAAWEILNARAAKKEIELYDKLLLAGRFHASFVVVGTKSNRMSGADQLNAQGIKSSKEVRAKFPLAWDGYVLSGGDFDSYEITLADARYGDPKMRAVLMSSTKIHGLFGTKLYTPLTYDEILATDGKTPDLYRNSKSGVFALLYGGDENTLVRNLEGVVIENARGACQWFVTEFEIVGQERAKTERDFCSITQPGGMGTAMIWHDPAEHVETFLGFKRFFTLENKIVKDLFEVASNAPSHWRTVEGHVCRSRGRVQTIAGATSSAIYGALMGIQAANRRAAENHTIQSPGGQITKYVQRKIWDLQPVGVHEFRVAPLNVHDEIDAVCKPEIVDEVAEVVAEAVESFRDRVPLIGMTWFKGMVNWAEKKAGETPMKISYKKAA